MIDIRCSQCQTEWKMEDSFAGTHCYCPRCRCAVDVPARLEAPPPADVLTHEATPKTLVQKILVVCPQCEALWWVDASQAGSRGMCPQCRFVLTVPDLVGDTPAAQPSLEKPWEHLPSLSLDDVDSDLHPLDDEEIVRDGLEVVEHRGTVEEDLPFVLPAGRRDEPLTAVPGNDVPAAEKVEGPHQRKKRRRPFLPSPDYRNPLEREPSFIANFFTYHRCLGIFVMVWGLGMILCGGMLSHVSKSGAYAAGTKIALVLAVLFILVGGYHALRG